MRVLAFLRYSAMRFEELARHVADRIPVPPRTVVVTADDGYADNDAFVAILARHAFPAAIFLVSDRLDGTAD